MEVNRDLQAQEKNDSQKLPSLLGEKVYYFNFLGTTEFQAFLNYLFILIFSFSKYFQNNSNYGSTSNNCEVMKFCNLGDQCFETGYLNSHWIGTTPHD